MAEKRTIEVSEETYQNLLAKGLGEQVDYDIDELDDMFGKPFFFRTVTYHLVGRVVRGGVNFRGSTVLQLEDASWVADSGRFMQAIKNGELKEVEPVGTAFINMGSVTDFFPWRHALPTEQK